MYAADALMSLVVRMSSRRGVIVNYHTLTAEQLSRHLEVLAPHFDFVSIDAVAARLHDTTRRPFCALTFDDGKRSNATTVAPVLDRLGVPAAFYVCTGFLDAGTRPLWFDRYDALARVVDPVTVGLGADIVKLLPAAERDARLDAACTRLGVDAELDDEDVAPMTWSDARALHSKGHAIGAHGTWHAIATVEAFDDAIVDIETSIATVRREVGACTSYAFPNGNSTEELARFARACGAETVLTTEPTWAGRGHAPWRLPRVQLFGEQTPDTIGLKLSVARVGRVLANPDGTRRRYAVPQWARVG
jgi:peptidoglycan/xylan/chitin deacetylase (PgdA/CDA1 family)